MKQQWTEEVEEKEEEEQRELAISFYMDELADVVELSKEEEQAILEQMLQGDQKAKERLIEGNLKYVIQVCANYIGKGIPLGDLIQEGNIALMMAISTWEKGDYSQFRLHIERAIQETMNELLDQEEEKEKVGAQMVERANLLSEVSKELADELGREATAEELAKRLAMTEEEIKDIMKMSLNALSVMTSDETEQAYPEDLQEAMEELELDQEF